MCDVTHGTSCVATCVWQWIIGGRRLDRGRGRGVSSLVDGGFAETVVLIMMREAEEVLK